MCYITLKENTCKPCALLSLQLKNKPDIQAIYLRFSLQQNKRILPLQNTLQSSSCNYLTFFLNDSYTICSRWCNCYAPGGATAMLPVVQLLSLVDFAAYQLITEMIFQGKGQLSANNSIKHRNV